MTEDGKNPSVRARVRALLPELAARGISASWTAIPKRGRAELFRRVGRTSDVVVLQRRLLNPWDLLRLRCAVRSLVFDFDDALTFRDSNRGASRSAGRWLKFRATVLASDLVVAGNPYLAGLAGRRAVVIPTSTRVQPASTETSSPVATEALGDPGRQARASGRRTLVLGWIGSASNLVYLRELEPALRTLASRREDWRLHVVCDDFPRFRGLPEVDIPWTEEREMEELRRFDIGLAPLWDDPWTRGKCGMKLLQYLSLGIPAVASRVGVQAEILAGGGGLLVEADGWVGAIACLLDGEDLRAQLGAEGPARVARGYAVHQAAEAWAACLERLD